MARKSKSSLENPLLYRNFLRAIKKHNPDLEIDPQEIDRTLEYEEAFNQLQKTYPDLRLSHQNNTELAEYRSYLCDQGFCDKTLQNIIIQDMNHPFTESELMDISYTIFGRSDRAMRQDKALKAPVTRDIRKYAKHPNRLDIKGLDYPNG